MPCASLPGWLEFTQENHYCFCEYPNLRDTDQFQSEFCEAHGRQAPSDLSVLSHRDHACRQPQRTLRVACKLKKHRLLGVCLWVVSECKTSKRKHDISGRAGPVIPSIICKESFPSFFCLNEWLYKALGSDSWNRLFAMHLPCQRASHKHI